MKTIIGPLLLCLAAQNVFGGSLPAFDPFKDSTANGGTAYAVGENLVGQNTGNLPNGPWYLRGNNNAGAQPVIASGSLGFPNLPPASGNSVTVFPSVGKTACLDLNLASGNTNTVYYSCLVKVTDLTAVGTTATINPIAFFADDPSLSLTGNTIARRGTRLLTKKISATTYVFGTGRDDNTGQYVYEPDAAAHSIGEVVFVVGSHQRANGVTNVYLWVNPPTNSFGSNTPPTPTLTPPTPTAAAPNGGLNGSSARVFAISCQFSGAPTAIIDEVRCSIDDWSSVTGGDPAILQNPANVTVAPGGGASLTVVARGTAPLAYQWIKDGTPLVNGGNISGADAATLSLSNVSGSDVGTYSVFVTNAFNNFVQSAAATLALTDPAITGQPQSRTNVFATTATFQVTASGTGPFSYQWHKAGAGDLNDGGNITGSHSSVLTVANVTFPDSGSYSVTVTGGAGTVDSSVATLTVRDPAVTTQPSSTTNVAGTSASFHVTAIGTAPLTYQWLKDGAALANGGNISGATSDTLTISPVSATDQAGYSVVVTGGFASTETSSLAELTVLVPASIGVPPSSRTITASNRVAFAVSAVGTAPIGYQWLRNGTNIAGETSFAYTIASAQASDQGSYSVIVSNAWGTATSSPATLTITPSITLYHNNFFVIRLGDGAQTLTLNGNSIYVDQFNATAGYINTFCVPDNDTNALLAVGTPNAQGTTGNITGTGLTRSANGRELVIAGYNTNIGYSSSLVSSTASTVPRGVGVITAQGQYSLPVANMNLIFSQASFRNAVYDGTNNFWGCANKGAVYYFGFDSAESSVDIVVGNIRSMAVFNTNIYYCSAVAGTDGIYKMDGMPQGAAPSTLLFATGTATADVEVSPNENLIYVADDRPAGSGGGIRRFEYNGSNWNEVYTLTAGIPSGARCIGADFSGPNPVLSIVTPESENNRLLLLTDSGPSSSATFIAAAGANQVFRGTRFGPVGADFAQSPTLSVTQQGSSVVLTWSGAFTLQSAANVEGTYNDIVGATSPYTNSVTSSSKQFFRLRK